MEIWVITTKDGRYVKAFRGQEDAYRFYDAYPNRYNIQQSYAD